MELYNPGKSSTVKIVLSEVMTSSGNPSLLKKDLTRSTGQGSMTASLFFSKAELSLVIFVVFLLLQKVKKHFHRLCCHSAVGYGKCPHECGTEGNHRYP